MFRCVRMSLSVATEKIDLMTGWQAVMDKGGKRDNNVMRGQ